MLSPDLDIAACGQRGIGRGGQIAAGPQLDPVPGRDRAVHQNPTVCPGLHIISGCDISEDDYLISGTDGDVITGSNLPDAAVVELPGQIYRIVCIERNVTFAGPGIEVFNIDVFILGSEVDVMPMRIEIGHVDSPRGKHVHLVLETEEELHITLEINQIQLLPTVEFIQRLFLAALMNRFKTPVQSPVDPALRVKDSQGSVQINIRIMVSHFPNIASRAERYLAMLTSNSNVVHQDITAQRHETHVVALLIRQ